MTSWYLQIAPENTDKMSITIKLNPMTIVGPKERHRQLYYNKKIKIQ